MGFIVDMQPFAACSLQPGPHTPPTTVTNSLRRRRNMTEEAALAAIDQACRRLRLPTIRAVLDEAITVAGKDSSLIVGFSLNCCWLRLMIVTAGPPFDGLRRLSSRGVNGSETSTSFQPRH